MRSLSNLIKFPDTDAQADTFCHLHAGEADETIATKMDDGSYILQCFVMSKSRWILTSEATLDKNMVGNGEFTRYDTYHGKPLPIAKGTLLDGKLDGKLTHYRINPREKWEVNEISTWRKGVLHGDTLSYLYGETLDQVNTYDDNLRVAKVEFGWNEGVIQEISQYNAPRGKHGLCTELQGKDHIYTLYRDNKIVKVDSLALFEKDSMRNLTDEEILILQLRYNLPCQRIIKLRNSYSN